MRFWFARGSEVPMRQQLVTQVVLGILCNDLAAGQRLPSTRELARRFHIHPNTISAAYRQLGRERWVEFRRGSGVYVRAARPKRSAPNTPEELIASLVLASRKAGWPLYELRRHLRQWLEVQPPTHFLLIEPDEELRQIVAAEIEAALKLPVRSCGFAEMRAMAAEGAVPVVLPSKAEAVRERLAPEAELLVLQVRSAPSSLAAWLPAPASVLLGVVSRWPGFLDAARTMLAAAGFDPDSLVLRDAREAGWQADLQVASAVVCDAATARLLPKGKLAIVFPIVSDASIGELREYERFIGGVGEG
ncbi:MAG TPA: GntR family transcriptional regulator [Acidobacteriaceae bacterium]|nr:GntR family transcriptional regulator [Acidobacteriaceae bacterium]